MHIHRLAISFERSKLHPQSPHFAAESDNPILPRSSQQSQFVQILDLFALSRFQLGEFCSEILSLGSDSSEVGFFEEELLLDFVHFVRCFLLAYRIVVSSCSIDENEKTDHDLLPESSLRFPQFVRFLIELLQLDSFRLVIVRKMLYMILEQSERHALHNDLVRNIDELFILRQRHREGRVSGDVP